MTNNVFTPYFYVRTVHDGDVMLNWVAIRLYSYPNLTMRIMFAVKQILLLLNYFIIFYMIFCHVSQNLIVLREQLSFIEDEDVHEMHDAVYKKYIMFK